MLFALTLLTAAMTRLADLAAVVEADTMPETRDFCVTGTVSYVLVFQYKLCHVLLENEGIGVDVIGSFRNSPTPDLGDRVRLDGKIAPSGAGGFLPKFSRLEIIGHGEAPRPLEGPAAEVMGGRCDFHRAYLVGEVRDVEPSGTDPCWTYLSIISDAHQYYAPIPTLDTPLEQFEALVGSTVKIDGFPDPHNRSFRFLDERRFLAAGMKNIEVLSPPPADPFEKAPPVESLRRLSPEMLPRLGRHKTSGQLITIWQSRNALLLMPDGRKALVVFSEAGGLKRGDTVEVIGYPSTDGFTLLLSRAIGRAVPSTPFTEPEVTSLSEDDIKNRLSNDFLRKSSLQGKRIQLCGAVDDFSDVCRERKIFPLSIAGRLLEVDYSAAPDSCEAIVKGCRVCLTGTCVLTSENWASLSSGAHLTGIRLVVDSPYDVKILTYPPWWTPARLAGVVAALLLLLSATLFWNRSIRRLSEKRGRELFRERSASALAELKTTERTRLAADIHDSISQILTGAAMQLDAGETNAAKRILASCRRELRACLWDLRNHALDTGNFEEAIHETLAPHLRGRAAVVDLHIPSDRMSEALRHAALCIIREATVNAIRHGRAETIEIEGRLDAKRLSFTITDDGKGFDPASCHGSADGHFGILGMRERAKAFNGSVEIDSTPGNGTKVTVVLEEKESTRRRTAAPPKYYLQTTIRSSAKALPASSDAKRGLKSSPRPKTARRPSVSHGSRIQTLSFSTSGCR